VKPGDMVEVLPEFLEEDEHIPSVGIIIRESEEWGEGRWEVLRGNCIVDHPTDTIRLIGNQK